MSLRNAKDADEIGESSTVVKDRTHGGGAPFDPGMERSLQAESRTLAVRAQGWIAAAERALETGSLEELHAWLAEDLARALGERFERVHAAADYDPTDVEAGRMYVAAYSEFIHLAEELHQRMQTSAHARPDTPVAVSHDH